MAMYGRGKVGEEGHADKEEEGHVDEEEDGSSAGGWYGGDHGDEEVGMTMVWRRVRSGVE